MAAGTDDLQAMGDFIRRARQLHSAPQVAQRLLNLTYDLQFNVGEVVACLRSDPALAAKILRVVNSAQYGVRSRVTSLQQAVVFLGQRSLRLTTMTFSLIDTLTRGAAGHLYQDFWRRSLTMAVVAGRLAARRPEEVEREAAYTAGLLADLGVLVMAQVAGEPYTQLYRDAAHGPDLVNAERAAYGFGHPALTARMLELWEFPAPLVGAVRHHHDAHARPVPLETAVALGGLLADVLWRPDAPCLAAVRRGLHEEFGLDTDDLLGLALSTKNDLTEQAALFDVTLPESFDCEALRERARELHAQAALETALEYDSFMATMSEAPAE